MQITLLCVGRMKKGPELEIVQTYLKRCPWSVKIIEVEERRPIKGAERMAREGDLIVKAIASHAPANAYIIALDERGKDLRSPEFASKINHIQEQGISDLIFLIGGADGYDPAVKQQANFLFSLGKLTWPHMMARAMLAEQIYRASTILSSHPYHKD